VQYLNIHIGILDYLPWQPDNRVCFVRIMEWRGFGDVPTDGKMP